MSTFKRFLIGATFAVLSAAAFAHDGHLNDAPWSACEDQHIGDACTFENSAKDVYRGTCRAMSDELMCVRNQPIEKFDPTTETALADD